MKSMAMSHETKQDTDRVKRIYRLAVELVQKLDDMVNFRKAIKEIFLAESINIRRKLLDYCEKLMFYDPKEFGKKAEEFLWRKVFYDIIHLIKNNKKYVKSKPFLESSYRDHLSAATGYYYQLILKLQTEFSLDLNGVVDFHMCLKPFNHGRLMDSFEIRSKICGSDEARDWAMKAVHRCIVILGDLARYQHEFDSLHQREVASRYYYQALNMMPQLGIPLNQLGTLAGSRTHNFDAVYFYARCLLCDTPFDGAEGNLKRIFEKNRACYLEHAKKGPKDVAITTDEQQLEDLKKFFVVFIQLLDMFQSLNTIEVDSRQLQDICQVTLQTFNHCMFFLPNNSSGETAAEQPSHLSDQAVFKIGISCMTAVSLLQKKGNKQVTVAVALCLAIFSHILNHLVMRLTSAVKSKNQSFKMQFAISKLDKDGDSTTDADVAPPELTEGSEMKTSNSDGKSSSKSRNRKSKTMFCRRRRTASSSSEDDLEISDDDSDEDEADTTFKRPDLEESEDEVEDVTVESSSAEESEDDLSASQDLPSDDTINDQRNSTSPEASEQQVEEAQNSVASNGSEETGVSSEEAPEGKQEIAGGILEGLRELQATALDWDAGRLFNQTLELVDFMVFTTPQSDDDGTLAAVAEGKKQVTVPPGFEESSEKESVDEITEKLNNFVIETDTDTSHLPTDTDTPVVTTESDFDTESAVDKLEQEREKLLSQLKIIQKQGLLSSIKVYCDWLSCHPQITTVSAKSSQGLWHRFAVLLNSLPSESNLAKVGICKNRSVAAMLMKPPTGEGRVQHVALSEDIHLQGFPPLAEVHKHLDMHPWPSLSSTEQTILRICSIRSFGHKLAEDPDLPFELDPVTGLFYGPEEVKEENGGNGSISSNPSSSKAGEDTCTSKTSVQKVDEGHRSRLMRNMAQLRLQAEVQELEGHLLSSQAHPTLPAYIVLDTSALCESLATVRQLIQSGRFIAVVPVAVIDQLDVMKKDTQGARDAIRWLENEFKRGNRFIRGQKPKEKMSEPPSKTLKKKNLLLWRFLQVIDCACYLNQQARGADMAGRKLVTILSDYDVTASNNHRLKDAVQTATRQDVSIQGTTQFFSKWKQTKKPATYTGKNS